MRMAFFSHVWFQAKAFPDILLDSEASRTSNMGAINNAAVCRFRSRVLRAMLHDLQQCQLSA